MSTGHLSQRTSDQVTIQTPCSPMYVGVIRLTATAISSRLGFTLDANEDLKLAVDEAASLVLHAADPNSILTSTFSMAGRSLHVTVEAPASTDLDRDSYGWGVLAALTERVDATLRDGAARIAFEITNPSGV